MDSAPTTSEDFAAVIDFDGGRLTFANPIRVIIAETLADVLGALDAVERAAQDGFYAVGYIAYEAAPAFDPKMRVQTGCRVPLLCFGIFDAPTPKPSPTTSGPFTISEWSTSLTESDHSRGIDHIRDAIAGGYTYQVNYTMRLRAKLQNSPSGGGGREEVTFGDDFAFYERLRRGQRAPYAAYLSIGKHRILSASPELFFQRRRSPTPSAMPRALDGHAVPRPPSTHTAMPHATSPSLSPPTGAGGEGPYRITTRPMKGTAPRGLWTDDDRARRDSLATSEKNRAENVMIVDLLRNDLGRIAETGSVKVDSLFDIERYPTVFQMTSTISADLKPSTTLVDIFGALFPCGSVTGAPKISTMSIITDLETDPRGVYCGAIGYVAPGGDATFNVAIRTVVIDTETGTAEYGTGGGITWDSLAGDEYSEAAAKAAVLRDDLPDFDLLETLALQNGEYALLQRHIDRLLGSAGYFDIDIDEAAVRRTLANFATDHAGEPYRVRLLVSQTGEITVEGQPLGPPPSTPTVAIATAHIDIHDRWLYHKTTHRVLYDRHKSQHPGAFDVLLWNERHEATEFTIGNLVVEIDGKKYTPPIECGLLPGTMRAELLANGEILERVITLEEAKHASTIWLVNSVRGWVEVKLAI